MVNVLELFGGCGGLGWGFKKEGFNIVAYNELDPKIAETYKANFKGTECIVGDITDPTIKQQIYDCFKDLKCNIILGGPPCVAYSMSGHRNSRDPRGQLFRDYIATVEKLQPDLFVMENVPGICSIQHDKERLVGEAKNRADAFYKLEAEKIELEAAKKSMSVAKGKQRQSRYKQSLYSKEPNTSEPGAKGVGGGSPLASRTELCSALRRRSGGLNEPPSGDSKSLKYDEDKDKALRVAIVKLKKKIKKFDVSSFRISVEKKIINTFQSKGYRVVSKVLNSADYGVPQRRKRMIFIGVKQSSTMKITFPPETHHKNGFPKWKTVREAIGDLKDLPSQQETAHILTNHQASFIEKIKITPIEKSVYKKYSEAFFRCHPDKPSGTVKENHGGVFVHYEKNRVMTPRELARLQSFPDDFVFKGTKSCILVQLGNAVPCGLSLALATHIKNIILRVTNAKRYN